MDRARSTSFTSARTLGITLVAGICLLAHGMHGESAPQPSAAQARPPSGDPAKGPVRPAAHHPQPYRPTGPRARSVPVRVRIPGIGVDAPLAKLALDRAGTLQLPPADKANLAGWYAKGPVPGEAGTAVVAGHVDTPKGRAVFYLLGALTKGSTIDIVRRDGTTAVFTVDAVEVYSKKEFPSKKVYGGSSVPQLRIITCGGGYNRGTGYLGNVVVFATLTRAK